MRASLGDGYVEALRETYDGVPDSADYVMYWWERAAEAARASKVRRFGFITTNSLSQVFNRRVVAQNLNAAKNKLSLVYAIPDHPWVDTEDGAAVRIAMTVGERGEHDGLLCRVTDEHPGGGDGMQVELSQAFGRITPDLKINVDVTAARLLRANEELSSRGVALHGAGFLVTEEQALQLGLGRITNLDKVIKQYRHGRDLTNRPRKLRVIDLDGYTAAQVRIQFPEVYQHVLNCVKPERDQNREPSRKENWWLFGRRNTELRSALRGLRRYISTVETSRHRFFVFLDANILPDNKLVNIALEDGFYLGTLSSTIHVTWALAAGGHLGVGNDPVYVKTRCFDPFPFPDCSEAHKSEIRALGEELDAHRKRQQELYPGITMTGMYNVLEKLRASEELEDREQQTYENGLVGVLKDIHDRLDRAVCDAYGWPQTILSAEGEDQILQRVLALNLERAREEENGVVRWLRPEYQQPQAAAVQVGLGITPTEAVPTAASARAKKLPWPSGLADQVRLVKDTLRANEMLGADEVAARFTRARRSRVEEILETLTGLGQIRSVNNRYLL
jgi:hypothetical protein